VCFLSLQGRKAWIERSFIVFIGTGDLTSVFQTSSAYTILIINCVDEMPVIFVLFLVGGLC
jgi:hypothetical protein